MANRKMPESIQVATEVFAISASESRQLRISLGRDEIGVILGIKCSWSSDDGADGQGHLFFTERDPGALNDDLFSQERGVLWVSAYYRKFYGSTVSDAQVSVNDSFVFPYPIVFSTPPYLKVHRMEGTLAVYVVVYYIKIVDREAVVRLMAKYK